jgi:WD40 repeat protein
MFDFSCVCPALQAGFLPDADAIGCIFRDNSVLVWDSISYAVKARLQPPDPTSTTAVSCFAASANGAHFIAGTRGGSILVWDLATQVLTRVIDMPQPACVVIQLLFLPDNVTAAVLCDDGHVVILSVAASTCKAVLDVSAPDRVSFRSSPLRVCVHGVVNGRTGAGDCSVCGGPYWPLPRKFGQ